MPEIKHNFTGGKMNKDLDERLVPNGQYRDAMNIQVSTSEGSDVGTVQNILGNSRVAHQGLIIQDAPQGGPMHSAQLIPSNPKCVGAVADESSDTLYWFLAGDNKDVIIQLKNRIDSNNFTKDISTVFVDMNKDTLKFDRDTMITGINVIDGMLFWTDNNNEPKKINIQRCIEGTFNINDTQTRLINDSQDIDWSDDIDMEERHITVLKKSPPTPPVIKLESERDPSKTYTGIMRITQPFTGGPANNFSSFGIEWSTGKSSSRYDFSGLKVGDTFSTMIETDIDGNSGFVLDWVEGDTILFKEFENDIPPAIPITNYRIKTKVTDWGSFRRSDTANELIINGDFLTPNSTGSAPNGWGGVSGNVTYSALDNALVFDDGIQWHKVYTSAVLTPALALEDEYRVTFTLSNVEAGGVTGYLALPDNRTGLTDDDGNTITAATHSRLWRTNYYYENGTYTENIRLTELEDNHANVYGYTAYQNKFYFQAVGFGEVDGFSGQPELGNATMASSSTVGTTIGTHTSGDAWEPDVIDVTEFSFDYTEIDDVAHANAVFTTGARNWNTIYLNNIMSESLIHGARYELDLKVTVNSVSSGFDDYKIGLSTSGGIQSSGVNSGRFDQDDFPGNTGTATRTIQFNANTSSGRIDFFVQSKSTTHPATADSGGAQTQAGSEVLVWGGAGYIFDATHVGMKVTDSTGYIPADTTITAFTPSLGATTTATGYQTPGLSHLILLDSPTNFNASHIGFNITDATGFIPPGTVITNFFPASGGYGAYISLSIVTTSIIPSGTTLTASSYPTITLSNPTTTIIPLYTGPIIAPTFTVLTATPVNYISSTFGVDFDVEVNLRKEKGFTGSIDSVSISDLSVNNARARLKILAMDGTPPKVEDGEIELKYAADKQVDEEKLFEFKLPRFATRYKYEDGEYSAFSPFSEIAFLPGSFDYHPKKGYNLGMTNRLKTVNIENIDTYIPDDVVSIDILYKEELSPNIYIVDTVKHNDWTSTYKIESETINSTLPSNQLLRPWDNVPRKALAQDIVGNRIVYGNYMQGYDLLNNGDNDYYPNINFDFISNNVTSTTAKSIKSLREYQLGVVFVDKHGRETPVISTSKSDPPTGAKKLDKREANKANQISVSFGDTNHMKDMEYFKFFVKETSGEYYNLAMDRSWDAKDDQVWVSFPSSDRNKIDIDTFLILKKGVETDELVTEPARYKVIAIENEAPDYIKTNKTLVEEQEHIYGSNNIFNNTLNDAPVSGRNSFKMNYEPFFDSSGAKLHEITQFPEDTLYVEFTKTSGETTSNRYKITSITTDYIDATSLSGSKYSIKLDKDLGDDVDFITGSAAVIDTTIVKIYKHTVENTTEFDGKFFVKLLNDDVFTENITNNSTTTTDYRVVTSKKLYSLKSNHETTHHKDITGQSDGLYDSGNIWNAFGRYAPFFRNYNTEQGTETWLKNGVATDVTPYIFGNGDSWRDEFLNFTSSGDPSGNATGWTSGWTTSAGREIANSSGDHWADSAAHTKQVWFIDVGNFAGTRHNSDTLDWRYIDNATGVNNGISTESNFMRLNIGMGGIYHDEISDDSDKSIVDFFGIGVDGGNPYYQGNVKGFVNKFNPGREFRFKEDPSATIYKIIPSVSYQRHLRYHDGTGATDPTTPITTGPWSVDNDQIAQLSPNFTRNWNMKFRTQDGASTTEIVWDPTNGDSLGPIPNGLRLSIDHHADTAPIHTTHGDEIILPVDSLNATSTSDGSVHKITEGMILTTHSNTTTTNTDGSTTNKDWLVIYKIVKINNSKYNLFLTGYSAILPSSHDIYGVVPTAGQALIFEQPAMNGYSEYSANRINCFSSVFSIDSPGLMAIGYNIEFIEPIDPENELPTNPAVWETESKESIDLDIYYEASGLNPILLSDDTINLAIPINSVVSHVGSDLVPVDTKIINVTTAGVITLDTVVPVGTAGGVDYILDTDELKITRPDGSSVNYTITDFPNALTNVFYTDTVTINTNLYGPATTYNLNWSNCYSYGNGVESNRVRDGFNLPYMSNGVKVSTTLEEGYYKEERRACGLIYSGLYNSIGSVNNLNQFIAAEKITKDINPIYGSIQKLHTRDSDLIALCEDKVLKIQANKDALYNADGNMQVTATHNVLGQAIPFVGEYGISRNPESFVSEAYRSYFTDKQRGTVMRLSKDGLTPISMHGMTDWFKDNLKLANKQILGSYDSKKDNYNLTLKGDIVNQNISTTVSFREDVGGWVSFKSFVPQHAISVAGEYYTISDVSGSSLGKIHLHHAESANRNTFYGNHNEEDYSTVNVILNDSPGSVKTFHTLEYEGSQSKIDIFGTDASTGLSDDQPYNLTAKPGWYVNGVETDKQKGRLNEFIEKEGKWFNYIRGIDSDIDEDTDFGAFDIQGIGILESISGSELTFANNINTSLQVGDIIYYEAPGTNSSFTTIDSSGITECGDVTGITNNTITVNVTGSSPTEDDYILFAKNQTVNTSSLLGYYADIEFKNDSIEEVKLFSVGSEVTESSK